VARRKLTDVSHPDEALVDDFWLQFGSDPQPPMRLKILYLTTREVIDSGPGSFNIAMVCDRLGVTYPMVNHYFGGRDGLLAEATALVYERYIQQIWNTVQKAPRNPEERLKAWIRGVISETIALGGWGPMLNYPLTAKEVTSIIEVKFQKGMTRLFELNLTRLASLILDLRGGSVTDCHYTVDDYPREDYLGTRFLREVLPTVSWAAFGASVWIGGRHAPARGVPELQAMIDELLEHHIAMILEMVQNHPD
jgi:AcrR family transcriptional regulator